MAGRQGLFFVSCFFLLCLAGVGTGGTNWYDYDSTNSSDGYIISGFGRTSKQALGNDLRKGFLERRISPFLVGIIVFSDLLW
jgi:hypothetical protein